MTLIVFLFILSLLILVHEFGHFYAARKNGVLVEEFGLGMPPAIFKKKVGETVYSLNWFLLVVLLSFSEKMNLRILMHWHIPVVFCLKSLGSVQ